MTFSGHVDDRGRIVPNDPTRQHAYLKARLAGQQVEYDVREFRSKRSDRQNRALWALLNDWAQARGWNPDQLKDVMLGIAFGHLEQVQPVTGEVVKVLAKPHSSHLNVSEFCHLIERVLETAAEDGHWLDEPSEYRKAKEAAAKQAAKKAA